MNWASFFTNIHSINLTEMIPFCLYLGSSLPKRRFYPLRIVLSVFFVYSFGLFIYWMRQSVSSDWRIGYNILVFTFDILMNVFVIFFCQKTKFRSALFLGIIVYTIRHMIYLLNRPFVLFVIQPNIPSRMGRTFAQIGSGIAITLLCTPAFYWMRNKLKNESQILLAPWWNILFCVIVCIVDVVFNLYAMPTRKTMGNETYFVLLLANFISCLLLLALMFGQVFSSELQSEVKVLNNLRKEEAKQYQITQETIDSINIKTHDLRHHLRDWAKEGGSVSVETIKSLEEATRIYDTRLHTSNHSLDTILQSKALISKNHEINLRCMADGDAVSFMTNEDIYSLFGNILDNAIAATENLLPPNIRYITLKIRQKAGGCFIYEENPFSGSIKMKNGMPVTSSKNTELHGYGMQSIAYVVKKYGGVLQIKTENQTFTLRIYFPSEEGDKKE